MTLFQRFSVPRTLLTVAILVSLLAPALNVRPASAAAADAASPRWHIVTVDSQGSVGQYVSIAIDPGNDLPRVAYYDATNSNVRQAWPSPGSSCPGNSGTGWACASVVLPNDQGEYASIAFRGAGDYGIAYWDFTSNSNRYYGDLGGIVYQNAEVYHQDTGYYNSLKFDSAGTPRMAFKTSSGGVAALRYAKWVGTNAGNCGTVNGWQCDTVDSGSNLGSYASLDLVWDLPVIAYAGNGYTLALARFLGSGGNCGPNSSWQCDVIDSLGYIGGPRSISLHASQCLGWCSDSTQIAYYDLFSKTLKYAKYVGGNAGNCGFGSQLDDWQCIAIETVGSGNSVSLAVYNGSPVIAYQDADDQGYNILKVARPVPAGSGGNCGPNNTWRCEVVDNGSQHHVAGYAALALNSAGLAYIAYSDDTAGDLKVAYQQFDVFVPLVVQ